MMRINALFYSPILYKNGHFGKPRTVCPKPAFGSIIELIRAYFKHSYISMKKAFWIILFLHLLGAAGYFAYPVIRDRYFPGQKTTREQPRVNIIFNNGSDTQSENSILMPQNSPAEEASGDKLQISDSDCENGCEYFTAPEELKYCRSFCGLTDPAATTDGCEAKSGLDRDACWKNQAILKNNFGLCDKIQDAPLKKSCQNRVTEDLLEQQISQ